MPKDRKFQELAELREKLLETVLLFDNVCKVSETLCHYDFRVHLQTLVLLQSLLRDAERKILLIASLSTFLARFITATPGSHVCMMFLALSSVLGLEDVPPLCLTGKGTRTCATDLSAPVLGSK